MQKRWRRLLLLMGTKGRSRSGGMGGSRNSNKAKNAGLMIKSGAFGLGEPAHFSPEWEFRVYRHIADYLRRSNITLS